MTDEYDSQGRRITRGAHVAKAQRELDRYDWQREEKERRIRQHKKLVPKFIPPSKMGAPVKYQDWMPQKVYEWLTDREVIFTKKLVAAHLHISHQTLNVWLGQYKDLSSAVAHGIAIQEAWLASQMADGMKYSASMYAVLKNLHDWKEKTEDTHKLSIGEALEQQRTGAKRVQWDKALPDPLAHKRAPLPVVDAQVVDQPTQVDNGTPAGGATQGQIPPQPQGNISDEQGGGVATGEGN